MGRRRKDQLASLDMVEANEAEAMDAAEVLSSPVQEQEESAPESVLVAEYHEELPAKAATKWLVLEDRTVSLFGQMTLLPAGTVVSAASYGPAGIKRIMEQGVELAPLE